MSHLCECGCGGVTSLIRQDEPDKGRVAGEYSRFLPHHHWRHGIRARIAIPPLQRFWPRIEVKPETGCWEWQGGLNSSGYGYIAYKGRPIGAHVFSYITFVGPLPAGWEPDHLCRNRKCVNPDHLEGVTRAVNSQRGVHPNTQTHKSHCPQGHPYDRVNVNGARCCSICEREARHRYRERHR